MIDLTNKDNTDLVDGLHILEIFTSSCLSSNDQTLFR